MQKERRHETRGGRETKKTKYGEMPFCGRARKFQEKKKNVNLFLKVRRKNIDLIRSTFFENKLDVSRFPFHLLAGFSISMDKFLFDVESGKRGCWLDFLFLLLCLKSLISLLVAANLRWRRENVFVSITSFSLRSE